MNIILLGPPGGGKGTQAAMACEKFHLVHLATGEIFREEIGKGTELGRRAQGYVTAGRLVPDQLVVEVVAERLGRAGGGVLLDGFPRTVEQARFLDAYLAKNGKRINAVIYLDLSVEEIVKRLASRWNCSRCGEPYNTNTKPSAAGNNCAKCGGELVQREDDRPETVKRRLMVFEDLTRPLAAYYRSTCVFHEVDASENPEQVGQKVSSVIDEAMRAQA